MTGGGGLTVKVTVSFPVPLSLLAEIVNEVSNTLLRVPEIRPVAVSRVRPSGKSVALKLDGVLSAVMV